MGTLIQHGTVINGDSTIAPMCCIEGETIIEVAAKHCRLRTTG